MKSLAEIVAHTLTKDLKWREAELTFMHKQLFTSMPGTLQEQVYLRANLAMIYAHYEGFCKYALGEYITALENLKLKRKELTWPLATYSMGVFYKELIEKSDRTEFFACLMNEFDSRLDEVAEYERPHQIANLWPDLLKEWLKRLDLQSHCVSNERILLESLVTNRNQIAHGKKLMVKSRVELDKYYNAATLAMHEVAVGITDALDKKLYKRHCIVNTILGHAV